MQDSHPSPSQNLGTCQYNTCSKDCQIITIRELEEDFARADRNFGSQLDDNRDTSVTSVMAEESLRAIVRRIINIDLPNNNGIKITMGLEEKVQSNIYIDCLLRRRQGCEY